MTAKRPLDYILWQMTALYASLFILSRRIIPQMIILERPLITPTLNLFKRFPQIHPLIIGQLMALNAKILQELAVLGD